MGARTWVVVPTYDEADSLPALLDTLLACTDATTHVMVVDDASPDGTGTLAEARAASEPRVHVLHRPAKAGLGSAYRDGFAAALAAGARRVVQMDADGSHDPHDVPRLLDALEGADVVVGSRYCHGGELRGWPARRLVLSRGANAYVRAWTGLPSTDATSGFRAVRRPVLDAIGAPALTSEGYAFQVELTLAAWRAGFRIVEVPITFTERRHGASKISRRVVAEAIGAVPRWGLAGPRRPGPPPPSSMAIRAPLG